MHRTSRPRRRVGPPRGVCRPRMRHEGEGLMTHEPPLLSTSAAYGPTGADATLASSAQHQSAFNSVPVGRPCEIPVKGSDPSGLRQCRATIRLLELLQQKEEGGSFSDASDGQPLPRCKSATESSCSVASADTCASSSQSEHSHASEEDMHTESPPQQDSNRQIQRQGFFDQQKRHRREEAMRQYQLLQEQHRRQHLPLLQQQRQEPRPQQINQQLQQQVFCDFPRSSSWSPPYTAILSDSDPLGVARRGSEVVSGPMASLHLSRSVPTARGGCSILGPQRVPKVGGTDDPFAASVFMRCPDASAIPLPASLLS